MTNNYINPPILIPFAGTIGNSLMTVSSVTRGYNMYYSKRERIRRIKKENISFKNNYN